MVRDLHPSAPTAILAVLAMPRPPLGIKLRTRPLPDECRQSPEGIHVLWWTLSVSNRPPPACKTGALPTELRALVWPLWPLAQVGSVFHHLKLRETPELRALAIPYMTDPHRRKAVGHEPGAMRRSCTLPSPCRAKVGTRQIRDVKRPWAGKAAGPGTIHKCSMSVRFSGSSNTQTPNLATRLSS